MTAPPSVCCIDNYSYLVEVYAPQLNADQLSATTDRARVAAAELTQEGTSVAFGRAIYLLADETCFHLFEAGSLAAIEAVSERAGFAVARIVQAIEQE